MTEVLSAPGNGRPHFAPNPLQRTSSSSHKLLSLDTSNSYLSSSKTPYTVSEYATEESISAPSSAPSSPQLETSTFFRTPSSSSTPASSPSLDIRTELGQSRDQDIQFPSFDVAKQDQDSHVELGTPYSCYDGEESTARPGELPRSRSSQWLHTIHDDHAIEDEPTRHVDYLSHQWREEDIWSSWRYIVARRKVYSNSVRLENASWRTWTKARCNLKTLSPETLNWLKDCDVTWLYGPLHTDLRKSLNPGVSPPEDRLSTSSSFIDKKPILKKKSVSQSILQRAISSHSLFQQAGAMIQAQQAGSNTGRPSYERVYSVISMGNFCRTPITNTPVGEDVTTPPTSVRHSYSSSGMESPSERRHIHFNNEVEQCIAVDSKEDEEAGEILPHRFRVEDDEEEDDAIDDDDDEEDEDVVMMKPVCSDAGASSRGTPRNSFSSESKTIKPLPSTTLKYRRDTPEPSENQQLHGMNGFWPSQRLLSPSSSQETLRPSRRQANFLLDDDEEDVDVQWQPSSYSPSSPSSMHGPSAHYLSQASEDEYDPGPGMRRTPSGMFMPYNEDEEEAALNNSLFGKVVDTVNTAKDIAHVIWNVGWRH